MVVLNVIVERTTYTNMYRARFESGIIYGRTCRSPSAALLYWAQHVDSKLQSYEDKSITLQELATALGLTVVGTTKLVEMERI